jgi:hypothetical protein
MTIANTYKNYSSEWWTPNRWIKWVTATFGTNIWRDPCPRQWKPWGNIDGLQTKWSRKVYCNPPGGRGAPQAWWSKYIEERDRLIKDDPSQPMEFIWCAFNIEQLRYLEPSPLSLPGYLVMPKKRVAFEKGGEGVHVGPTPKSPSNWAVWWTTVKPSCPPDPSIIQLTGPGVAYDSELLPIKCPECNGVLGG